MEVLLFGGTGGLGRAIQQVFRLSLVTIVAPTRQEMNLSNLMELSEFMAAWFKQHPDCVVIYAAGLTNIDECQTNSYLSYLLNVDAPCLIARYCWVNDCRFVYFSTDQVFGECPDPHAEDDELERWPALNTYGAHKGSAEMILRSHHLSTIARVQWLYGGKPSWVDSVVADARARKPITVLTDYLGVPTNSHHVAQALLTVLNRGNQSGTWHLVADGPPIDRSSLAKFILDYLNLRAPLIGQTTDQMTGIWAASRTKSGLLTNTRLADYPLPDWQEALTAYLESTATGKTRS